MTHSAQAVRRSGPPRVVRFSKAARIAHWGHTVTFLILLLTGLLLFAPKVFGWVGPAFLGANSAGTVHRVMAVFYTIIPLACLLKEGVDNSIGDFLVES
jgi:formate dehydrogenase subunit gamma